jgi:NAD(P)-dependent dehydrogenase (short-subunit alcohol dehydrogenase family)
MSISGFSSDSAAVIVGASRGIGLALVEAIANGYTNDLFSD